MKSIIEAILWLSAIFCLTLSIGCGGDKSDIDSSSYAGWEHFEKGQLRFHISPKSRWLNDKEQLAEGYSRFIAELCNVLEMPVPPDTIDIYVYAPGMQIHEITGQDGPFHTENAIHWAGLTPYGYQLSKFLLMKKGIEPGQFKVINEGVPHLLDFSSINYHDKLNRINNSGMFVGIIQLGDNQKFDSLDYTIQRTESASLAGFIMYNYGVDRLFMLWKSSVDWRRSIETIFQLPIDEFENNWLQFAREFADDPEGTVEDDTTLMFRTVIQNE